MKFIFILLPIVYSKIISNYPSCKHCIYYKPTHTPMFSKCEIFGKKDVLTGEIIHDFAYHCRNSDDKCGMIGYYFKEEKNIFRIIYKKINKLYTFTFILSILLLKILI
jgi:hypothetical protein